MPLARIDVPAALLVAAGLAILGWLTLAGRIGFQVRVHAYNFSPSQLT